MTEIIDQREIILNDLVSLRTSYIALCSAQHERFSAISLSNIPDHNAINHEMNVFSEEASLTERFIVSVSSVPSYSGDAKAFIIKPGEKSRWFSFKREPDTLVEIDDPHIKEASVQTSRIIHLCEEWVNILHGRREVFEHHCYEVRKLVVTLNDAARVAVDGSEQMARERHLLESFVTLLNKTSASLLILIRKLEDVRPKNQAEPQQDAEEPISTIEEEHKLLRS